ncbi:sugar phosphate isomerase/epimerase family protein [Paenibacillus puerhi]|uniref:sugar phosphate isomerase/epimerase family protein n=1 Tax=Paenibacillus puerhi TaxID=2692622 RepID=UPI0013585241|nr:sugar phosphate isomerase/epimerase [Paenibacillus puerhi]
MNRLGFMSYIYMGLSAEEMAQEASRHGFGFVQLDPRQKLQLMDDEPFSPLRAERVRTLFASFGIELIGLSGYTNLMNPDLAKREQKLQQLEKLIDLCPAYGTRYILTETGSLHPGGTWRDTPENRTEEAWEQLVRTVDRLRTRAVKNGAVLILEGFVCNVLSTGGQAVRLLNELGTEGIGFVMDPFNYMTREDLTDQESAMKRLFDQLAPYCPLAHAKDTLYAEDGTFTTPRVGAGKSDWAVYAKYVHDRLPNVPLILEHAEPQEVTECLELVRHAFRQAEELGPSGQAAASREGAGG